MSEYTAKIVRLPKLPPGGDVSDFFDAGGTVAELMAIVEATPEWTATDTTTNKPSRVTINVDALGLMDMAIKATEALVAANDPPVTFRYAGKLGRVSTDDGDELRVVVMNSALVSHELAQIIDFVKPTRDGGRAVFPPEGLARDLLAVPPPQLPRLVGLVRVPVFLPSGRLLQQDGYDMESGLYLALSTCIADERSAAGPDEGVVASRRPCPRRWVRGNQRVSRSAD